MYGISIDITDNASPSLAAVFNEVGAQKGLREVAGRQGRNTVREHLFKLDAERENALGGKRTHFYSNAANSTNFRLVDDGVVIAINHTGLAQRYFGGPIRPVNSTYLAIPARAEAHGKRPREFSNLEIVFGRGRRPVGLAETRSTDIKLRKKKDGTVRVTPGQERGGLMMFWLVKEAYQAEDPTVLPTAGVLGGQILERVTKYMERTWRNGGLSNG